MAGKKPKNGVFALFKDFFTEIKDRGKGKNYLLLSLLLLGIILMFAGSLFTPLKKVPTADQKPRAETEDSPVVANTYEKNMCQSLQQVLEHIDGISQVQVFINFTGSKESTYGLAHEENSKQTIENDREGGQREILESNSKENYVLLREANGGEKPLLLSESMPQITGVLVVAQGVENSCIRLKVVHAMQSVLNLPAHRIAVLPLGRN